MPTPTTSSDFLDLVRKSGLIPTDRQQAFQRAVATLGTDDLDRLADGLIRTGHLTPFQAKQLKQGRYKRFQIAGKYRLLELLGVGGMGAVYLCEHEYMKRLVAVKVLPVDKIASDPTALQRFYREARAVAALDHPNVVHAYDIDKFDNVHFLVMEYVDGTSLQDVVARYTVRGQFFDPVRAAHYIAQAAAGLHHATRLGLIHRDVKPGNLLLDRNGVVKVLDMGLARFFDERHDNLTQRFDDKCVLGTADYLAPEQASNDPVDVRADIYGLGGSLYYLLTGQSPFPDGNVAQKLVAHQTREPKPVSAFRGDVPPGLLAVLERMMRKKPVDRYQSPVEVIAALEPWTRTPIDPPPSNEMPVLCPAVMELIGLNPIPGRADGSTARYPTLPSPGSGGSAVRVSHDRSEATVPTERAANTAPIPRTPLAPPAPVRPAPTASGYPLRTLIAVGAGSLVLGGLVASALFLLLG